jgi:potassium-transporting ATPase potassium-binding subunit
MSTANWIELAVLIGLLLVTTRVVGAYVAAVFGGGKAPGDRIFLPVERLVYRACGVDPNSEQTWPVYTLALLAFSLVSVLGLYALERLQGHLPLNPTDAGAVPPALAFNTAVSFVTNTNWQNYGGELTMSHLTQMAGLAVQNFVSAAVGLCVAVALIRGLVRRRSKTIGNFWVDLTRGTLRLLVPLAIVFAFVLVSQGIVQNFHGFTTAHTLQGTAQSIPGGPVASQEVIKELGENGGGFYNANAAHPFENPNGLTDFLEIFLLLMIPFALTYTYGRFVKDQKQGWVLFAVMFAVWIGAAGLAMHWETNGNPKLQALGAVGGNMEGKEVRFGTIASGLYAASTTGTSTGSVNSSHDSFTPLGGAVPLVHMMLGEVSPGGTGAGLYAILVFALLSVFIAGLMVGRTPEYIGKKVQATEMKLVVVYLIVMPLVILGFSSISVVLSGPLSSILSPGPHGLSEVVYAYTSAANNNGSAFGGLTGNTDWYNTTLGLTMLFGRFFLIVPVLAIAGSLARKQPVPATAGTFPTNTPLFAVLLLAIILTVVGLTYFPVVSLGPVLEHLTL